MSVSIYISIPLVIDVTFSMILFFQILIIKKIIYIINLLVLSVFTWHPTMSKYGIRPFYSGGFIQVKSHAR